jgi:hypothetical protein
MPLPYDNKGAFHLSSPQVLESRVLVTFLDPETSVAYPGHQKIQLPSTWPPVQKTNLVPVTATGQRP